MDTSVDERKFGSGERKVYVNGEVGTVLRGEEKGFVEQKCKFERPFLIHYLAAGSM